MSDIDVYNHVETPNYPAFFTPFSIFHALTGILAFVILRWIFPNFPIVYDFIVWFVVHSIYEFRDVFKPETSNSSVNSFGDTIASMLGFFIAWIIFQDRRVYFYDVLNFALLVLIFSFVIPELPS